MRMLLARPILLALLLVAAGCNDKHLRPEGPVGPDPVPPAETPLRIEYRVSSAIPNLDIVYSNAAQGTTFLITTPPWFLTFDTLRPRTYVYLQASAPFGNVTDGPLVAQIFVNGELFREATARGVTPSVTVSGEVVR